MRLDTETLDALLSILKDSAKCLKTLTYIARPIYFHNFGTPSSSPSMYHHCLSAGSAEHWSPLEHPSKCSADRGLGFVLLLWCPGTHLPCLAPWLHLHSQLNQRDGIAYHSKHTLPLIYSLHVLGERKFASSWNPDSKHALLCVRGHYSEVRAIDYISHRDQFT